MTQEIMIKELSEIVNKFDVFRTIALDMNWVEIKEYHVNWHRNFPIGFMIDLYHFPKGYVDKHFKECYIRCRIAETAYYEEWEKDYFNVPKEERKEYIDLYETINTYKELRLKAVPCDELRKEIQIYSSENGITEEEQNKVFQYLEGAVIVDIGCSYSIENTCIAVKGDTIITTYLETWS